MRNREIPDKMFEKPEGETLANQPNIVIFLLCSYYSFVNLYIIQP
jgi:hypothetical protein